MGTMKIQAVHHAEVLRLESEINNLWGELNTANVPHTVRMDLEGVLSGCEEEFKAVLGGQSDAASLEKHLHGVDLALAESMIQQAQNEISKSEHAGSAFQALENIRRELESGKLTPIRARHEVKGIMRHRA